MPLHLLLEADDDGAPTDLARLRERVESTGGSVRSIEPGVFPDLSEFGITPDETFVVLCRPQSLDAARTARVRACAIEPNPARLPLWTGCDEIWESEAHAIRWLDRQIQLESRAWPVATVGGLVFRRDERALFVRTAKWSGTWGVPGGKVDYGETCEAAFAREIREETGLVVRDIHFELVQDAIEEPEFHRPRHFILLNYTARTETDSVRLNHESLEYGWFSIRESLGLPMNRPTRVLLEHLHRLPESNF